MRLNHLTFNDSNKILWPHGRKASVAAGVSLGFSLWFFSVCCQGQSNQYTASCQSLIQGTVEGKGRGPLPKAAGSGGRAVQGLAVSDCFQNSCSASQGLQKNSNAHEEHRKVFKGSEI